MPEDPVRPESGSIPGNTDSELRRALRKQLQDMFRNLDLISDEIGVVSEAARSEGQPEIANVLGYCVSNRLFDELTSLTNIIEWLGGRTALSETQVSAKEAAQCGGTTHAQ